MLTDRYRKIVHHGSRLIQVHPRQEKAELLAAPPGALIPSQPGLPEQGRQLGKRVIPAGMPVGIVHVLEEINIGNRRAEGFPCTSGQIALHLSDQEAAVWKSRQRIGFRFPGELLIVQSQLAFRLLDAVAEDRADAGHQHKQRRAVQGLKNQPGVRRQSEDRVIGLRIGEQQHPIADQRQEAADFPPGRHKNIEKAEQQKRQQEMLTAAAPAHLADIPPAPEHAQSAEQEKTEQHIPAPHGVFARSHSEKHQQREQLPASGLPRKKKKMDQKIQPKQFLAHRQGAPVIDGCVFSRFRRLLGQKPSDLLHTAILQEASRPYNSAVRSCLFLFFRLYSIWIHL